MPSFLKKLEEKMGIRQLKPRENWTKKWLDELLQSLPTEEIRKIIVEITEDNDFVKVLWKIARLTLKMKDCRGELCEARHDILKYEFKECRKDQILAVKDVKNFVEKCDSRKTLVRILKRIVRDTVEGNLDEHDSIKSIFSKFLEKAGNRGFYTSNNFGSYISEAGLRKIEKRISERDGVAHIIKVYKLNDKESAKIQLWPVLSQCYYSQKKNQKLKNFLLKIASNKSSIFRKTAQAVLRGKRIRYVKHLGYFEEKTFLVPY